MTYTEAIQAFDKWLDAPDDMYLGRTRRQRFQGEVENLIFLGWYSACQHIIGEPAAFSEIQE